jgi:hypothetical protein
MTIGRRANLLYFSGVYLVEARRGS